MCRKTISWLSFFLILVQTIQYGFCTETEHVLQELFILHIFRKLRQSRCFKKAASSIMTNFHNSLISNKSFFLQTPSFSFNFFSAGDFFLIIF